jgi:hypothetical protein
MKQELLNLIEQKSPGAKPLYLVIRGSHAYGTNVSTSDTDYAGVFIQSMDDILGLNYKEQINDDSNDTVIYELRRFLGLLASNNPTVLELLNTPEDCVIYKDPVFDLILENRDKFITKICANSFGGYAKQQISKAKGQDKKQNWEKDKVTRKTPLDFCYIHRGEKSIPLVNFMEEKGMDQRFCGLSNLPHSRDTYALFYDFKEEETNGEIKNLGFKGIAFEDSNQVRLSSIPVDTPKNYFIGHMSYNKDGYSQHCKDYLSYQEWLENRNEARWVDVKSHGQKIDGKNMMHCKRLMGMAREIAEGKGIVVRRQDAEYLISIRRGEVDLQTLIDEVEVEIKEIDRLFKESNLPDSVDVKFINDLLINIRKKVYNI